MGKLVRSNSNKVVLGVCAGLAERFGINVTMVRAIFAITTILGVGSPVIIYIILAILMPSEG